MNLQRINVKIFTDAPERIELDAFLGIFARWREDSSHPCSWVDLADYAHVEKGPGIMLIGRRGNVSLDLGDPGPGILYGNKKDLEESEERRIEETFRRSVEVIQALTAEPEYPAAFRIRPGFWQLTFNDRLDAPNTDETDRRLRPVVEAVLDRLLGRGDYSLIRESDASRRYGFTVYWEKVGSLDEIAARL